MVARRVVLAVLLLGCAVQPLAGQNVQTQQAIDRLSAELKEGYGFVFNDNPPAIQGRTWQTPGPGDQQHKLRFLLLLGQEMAKHSPHMFKNVGTIEFGMIRYYRAETGVVRRAASYSEQHDVIYVDLDGVRSDSWSRGMVHHELFHLLHARYYGSTAFVDPKWTALNPPRFRYGQGGDALLGTVQSGHFSDPTHPAPGFLNLYSMTSAAEDQAELFEALHHDETEPILRRFARQDPLLGAKVAYLERQKAFWSRDLSTPRGRNYRLLLSMLLRRHAPEVNRLLALPREENPADMVGPHGWRLAHAVTAYQYPIEAIRSIDLDVHVFDDDGWTPLHYAVIAGPPENVTALLAAGADPDWKDKSGRSPRAWSLQRGTMTEANWRKIEADLAKRRRTPAFEEAYLKQVDRRKEAEARWRAENKKSPVPEADRDDQPAPRRNRRTDPRIPLD